MELSLSQTKTSLNQPSFVQLSVTQAFYHFSLDQYPSKWVLSSCKPRNSRIFQEVPVYTNMDSFFITFVTICPAAEISPTFSTSYTSGTPSPFVCLYSVIGKGWLKTLVIGMSLGIQDILLQSCWLQLNLVATLVLRFCLIR